MNRRTAALIAVALAVAGSAVVVGVYDPLGSTGGTADAAETPRFTYDGERLTLEPAPEQSIRGETDLDADTELSVRLRSSGENPFLKSATATVEDDGAFEATFDMTGVEDGTTFDVVVQRNGSRVMNTTGEVVA